MTAANLGQRFATLAASHPGRTALRLPDGLVVSYGELLVAVRRWAGLLHARGVRRHDVVALLHDKSIDAYAAMLGALMLGAPHVCIDPENPAERLHRIAQTCRPVAVVAPSKFIGVAEEISAVTEAAVIVLDDEATAAWLAAVPPVPEVVMAAVHGGDPAYLMFTSGSTGFPKGAVMSHANVAGFVDWVRERFQVTADDVFTGLNPAYFDNSVFDFYGALFTGASLAPFPTAALKHPRRLVEQVSAAGCTIWFSVPSLIVYALNLRAIGERDLPALRTMVFGGEGFPKARLRDLHRLLGARVRLVNVYGPTECTCICSSFDVRPQDLDGDALLPLGPLNPGFDGRVLDDEGQLLPPGATGELALAGTQVGLGYWRDPERTARAFVTDPGFAQVPSRMYRTGDLVRHDADTGWFHFLGRVDHQIKHMGYRIELEEIEQVVGGLPWVAENAAVYQRAEGAEFGRIVLFWVGDGERDDAAMLDQLRRSLPAYMVPSELRRCAQLPKNANGKIDRPALRAALQAETA